MTFLSNLRIFALTILIFNVMAKKLLFYLVLGVGIITLTNACKEDEKCMDCKQVLIEDGQQTTETESTTEYCGDDLDSKLNNPESSVGGDTARWICQ